MNYEVKIADHFKKELSRLIKKYPSLYEELDSLIDSLMANPMQGTSIGNNIYKIRLAIDYKHTGKSGGARIITVVATTLFYFIDHYARFLSYTEQKPMYLLEYQVH